MKLAGFRVELGEIEVAAIEHAGVAAAAATVQYSRSVPVLSLYVSPQDVDIEHVRRSLQRHLPGYMIPSRILTIGSMPLTQSGKLDRRALSAATPSTQARPELDPHQAPAPEADEQEEEPVLLLHEIALSVSAQIGVPIELRRASRPGAARFVAAVPARSLHCNSEGTVLHRWRTVWEQTYAGPRTCALDQRGEHSWRLAGYTDLDGQQFQPREAVVERWAQAALDRITSLARVGAILEVGCGAGILAKALCQQFDYIGVDPVRCRTPHARGVRAALSAP